MRLLTHLQNKGRSNRAGLIPKLEVLDDTLSFLLKLASLRSKLEKESFRLAMDEDMGHVDVEDKAKYDTRRVDIGATDA